MFGIIVFYSSDYLNFDFLGENVGKKKRNYFVIIYCVFFFFLYEFEKEIGFFNLC